MGTSREIDGEIKGQGIHGSLDSSTVLDRRKQLEKVDEARQTDRKQNP
jgi:hypothetical protein